MMYSEDEAMENEIGASGKVGDVVWEGLFEYDDDGGQYLVGSIRGPGFLRPIEVDLVSKREDESVTDFVNKLVPRLCMVMGVKKEVYGIDKLEVIVDGERMELKDIDEGE